MLSIVHAIDWDTIISQTAPNLAGASGNLGVLIAGHGYFAGLYIYVFFFAGVALLLYLVYGGISLLLSKGDPKAVESGKKIITNAIIGFAIIFVAYWIVQIVGYFLGLPEINTTFTG